MSEDSAPRGRRERLTAQAEDALGKLAQDLLENPLVNGALSRAFDAREKAAQAQEVAMGALNLPSAADLERLTRRLRSVSQRLEGIEDGVDRLDGSLQKLSSSPAGDALGGVEARLAAIEEQLAQLTRQLAEVQGNLPGASAPIPLAQERLQVEDAAPAPARRRAPRAKAK